MDDNIRVYPSYPCRSVFYSNPTGAKPAGAGYSDKTHRHPCSSVVSVSIRGLFRRVTISAPTRVLFLAHVTRQARVPSPVTGIRTPKLPLLPLWEKGVGGMRGHRRLPLLPAWQKGVGGMRGHRRLPLLPAWQKGVGGMRGQRQKAHSVAPPRNGCVTLVA
jgi:hypothetical protein